MVSKKPSPYICPLSNIWCENITSQPSFLNFYLNIVRS
jgi:hypothetical protein